MQPKIWPELDYGTALFFTHRYSFQLETCATKAFYTDKHINHNKKPNAFGKGCTE